MHSATDLEDSPHQARLQRWKYETKSDDPIQSTQYLPHDKDSWWNLWKNMG